MLYLQTVFILSCAKTNGIISDFYFVMKSGNWVGPQSPHILKGVVVPGLTEKTPQFLFLQLGVCSVFLFRFWDEKMSCVVFFLGTDSELWINLQQKGAQTLGIYALNNSSKISFRCCQANLDCISFGHKRWKSLNTVSMTTFFKVPQVSTLLDFHLLHLSIKISFTSIFIEKGKVINHKRNSPWMTLFWS